MDNAKRGHSEGISCRFSRPDWKARATDIDPEGAKVSMLRPNNSQENGWNCSEGEMNNKLHNMLQDFVEGAFGFFVVMVGVGLMVTTAAMSIGGILHGSPWFLLGFLLIPIWYGIMDAILMRD